MSKSKFSESQIVAILKEREAGLAVAEIRQIQARRPGLQARLLGLGDQRLQAGATGLGTEASSQRCQTITENP